MSVRMDWHAHAVVAGMLLARWAHLRWAAGPGAFRRRRPMDGTTIVLFVVYAFAVIGWLSAAVFFRADRAAASSWSALLVVIAVGAGVAFRVAGASALRGGFSWESAPVADALVVRGIYSRIRHPLLVGYTLEVLGLSLAAPFGGPWPAVSCTAVVAAASVIRARREDEQLKRTFGSAWQRWAAATWF